ncbi:MAG TPA: hypothetical protein VI875_00740 [Candidatus Norongarragalinales archaeon]|nr:hypothetical protein [Candidatus Norongarragalinales archaeon]
MKAFVSFPAALLFVLVITVLALTLANASTSSLESSGELVSLERKHYADAEVKKVFSQVFELSAGSDERQSSEAIAENLARLDAIAKERFGQEGVGVELWFGEFDSFEEQRVLQETLSRKKPARCAHCYSFAEFTVDWDGKPVRKSIELVFGRKISKLGLAHTPSSAEWVGKNVAFGATFYSQGMAWVSAMREGFG